MMRGDRGSWFPSGLRALVAGALVVGSGCGLGVEADKSPASARVRVEGTSPHALMLVLSTEFYEEYDPVFGGGRAALLEADTLYVALPFDETLDLSGHGRVYVELRNPIAADATVRLRVELDNGRSYDRNSILGEDGALVYYYLFSDV